MPLVMTSELVEAAQGKHVGVLAFNAITIEHAEAIVTGAEKSGIGTIVQISQNAVRFHAGRIRPLAAAVAVLARDADVAISLHLDHVDDEDLLHEAAKAGFSSVMYDASRLSYEENVQATRGAAEWAHREGLWIEAELGEVGGKLGAHDVGARTDPSEAAAYVAATGVDALAVAVGSKHAMTERTATLDCDLIAQLRHAVSVPLVLHGSSGVPDDALRAAVNHGMVKINVGTALNVSFSAAVRECLGRDTQVVDPRKYLTPARAAMTETVENLIRAVAG